MSRTSKDGGYDFRPENAVELAAVWNSEDSGAPEVARTSHKKRYSKKVLASLSLAGALIFLVTAFMITSFALPYHKDTVVVLVSIDGFRWDFLSNPLYVHPSLDRICRDGIARVLPPLFPPETWPNLVSAVTGLYPEAHGVVGNTFYDSKTKEFWSFVENKEKFWYDGEFFWDLVARHNRVSACCGWPGCDASYEESTRLLKCESSSLEGDQVKQVLNWLDMSALDRPEFIAVSFGSLEEIGRVFGEENDLLKRAVRSLDAHLGDLYEGIRERSLRYNIHLMIVSSHGFEVTSNWIYLDLELDLSLYEIPELQRNGSASKLAVWPKTEEAMNKVRLLKIEHVRIELSFEKWHYRTSRRISPVYLVADTGYVFTVSNWRHQEKNLAQSHGWDIESKNMQGVLIATGPAFKKMKIEKASVLDIYQIIASILEIPLEEQKSARLRIK
ncbi:uncharacterized protein LOC126330061 isoform X2 [Schistocerca gregaria]|uniref:uncharacterized protein LOC126330061 isoform X2 n=1 Tax=Schistocerca gregaria TaxID=7010 RepID=UPI00211EE715|nr:uncharacterized protein LOC126330061 isoform X2 [Schistocerca gregaria]